MQVILLERIPKLGQMGDIVDVAPGYARNYLIPQGKAIRATKQAIAEFEQRRKELEARNLELRREAEAVAERLRGQSVTVIRQASDTGHLYGSVTPRDIVAAFAEVGVTLDRRQVRLERTIKTLGVHEVTIVLHPEVEVPVSVNVARSEEEAEVQASAAGLLEKPEEAPLAAEGAGEDAAAAGAPGEEVRTGEA